MTMFSMKPPFNMAEFLAVPAKPDAFKRRMARNAAKATAATVATEEAEAPAPVPPKTRKP